MNDNDTMKDTTASTELGAAAAPREKKRRGFAVMDRRVVSEIARKGGVAAHQQGTAHEFDSTEAAAAGRKGGLASHAARRRRKESSQGA